MGLDPYLSQQIATLRGGTLEVQPAPTGGAAFVLRLPLVTFEDTSGATWSTHPSTRSRLRTGRCEFSARLLSPLCRRCSTPRSTRLSAGG